MALQTEISWKEIRNEEFRRRLGVRRKSRHEQYIEDPAGFIANSLGEFIWSKQREVCQALIDYDRVAVKSCHQIGKSFVASRIVAWFLACHPPGDAFVVTSAPSWSQVRAVLWREINRAHTKGRLPGRCNQTEWWLGNEMVAFGRKPDDQDMTAFQGLHQKHLMVVLDEACGVPPALWNAAETLVANEGGKILAIGNPDDPNTEFGAICRPGGGYHVVTVSAFDTPNFTGEEVPEYLRPLLIHPQWVEERKKRWGESSPLYVAKVLGEFPDVSDDSLLSPKHVQAAVDRELPAVGPSELGVDVARSLGGNESVVYWRRGPVARLKLAIRTRDVTVLHDHVVRIAREVGATKIKVDDPGVGGGLVDFLNRAVREGKIPGVEVIGVNTGLPADVTVGNQTDDAMARFKNLKAQYAWELRDRFVAGEIDLDPEDDVVQSQATQIKYFQTPTGLVQMESKDDMAKRLGSADGAATGDSKSPDRWDALVLAFCQPRTAGAGQVDMSALVG